MRAIILSAALFAATSVAAQDNAAPVDDSQAWFGSPSRLTQQTGEGIYNAVCAGCHMPDGQGAVGAGEYPALANNDMLAHPSYAIFLTVNGSGAMPPLGGILDDAQIAAVVDYIRTSFGNDFTDPPATAEMVAETR